MKMSINPAVFEGNYWKLGTKHHFHRRMALELIRFWRKDMCGEKRMSLACRKTEHFELWASLSATSNPDLFEQCDRRTKFTKWTDPKGNVHNPGCSCNAPKGIHMPFNAAVKDCAMVHEQKYFCPRCYLKFGSKGALNIHIWSCHEIDRARNRPFRYGYKSHEHMQAVQKSNKWDPFTVEHRTTSLMVEGS